MAVPNLRRTRDSARSLYSQSRRRSVIVFLAGLSLAAFGGASNAAVTISTAATQNMNCSGGVCSPTASIANLNVTDLENDLASGNLIVTTTGSGVEATDMNIDAGIAWTSPSILSLQAYHSIAVGQPIAVNGTSGLTILTNNGGSGGTFSFAEGANVSFLDLASALSINGAAFALENSVQSLGSAIATNPVGSYALANNYNAAGDGTYTNSPIPTQFGGYFEGLGNTISNLSMKGTDNINTPAGLFAQIQPVNGSGGVVENITLQNVSVTGGGIFVGGLAGSNNGTISGSFASGAVSSAYHQASLGILVGTNGGTISRSGATGTVSSIKSGAGGGLAGSSGGVISQSYANCTVSMGKGSDVGGLTGENLGSISQSYSIGSVRGGVSSRFGGLLGSEDAEQSTIAQSYSTTAVKDDKNAYRGGLIGEDFSPPGNNTNTYWDTTTSQVKNPKHGAGKPKSDPGITGLTTTQLQAGLPSGFDPIVWAENPSINGGFPYLINNPPR
jgi:hypothetical protein